MQNRNLLVMLRQPPENIDFCHPNYDGAETQTRKMKFYSYSLQAFGLSFFVRRLKKREFLIISCSRHCSGCTHRGSGEIVFQCHRRVHFLSGHSLQTVSKLVQTCLPQLDLFCFPTTRKAKNNVSIIRVILTK